MASGGQEVQGTVLAGTVRTQLGSDVDIPSTCREVVSFTPYGIPVTFTADAEMSERYEITSIDVDVNPTDIAVFTAPAENATITTGANSMIFNTYDMHVPVTGGEIFQAFATNIVDPTTDPFMGGQFLYSDRPLGVTQVFWTHPNALSAYGTGSSAFVEGSTYRFNNCMRIVNCYGFMATNTITISDSLGGCYRLQSPDFKTKMPQEYPYQGSNSNVVAASTEYCPRVILSKVDIPTEPIVAITEAFNQEGTTIAGGASFITGVGYNKLRRR